MSSGFRITQRTLTNRTLSNLQSNLDEMQRIQEHLSSGKQLNRPSDSPTGTANALRYRSEIRRNEQLARNAEDGLGWLGTADTTLTQSSGLVRHVRDLVLKGLNASSGVNDRAAIAVEIDGIRENLLALGNTEYLGRPIFAGSATTDTAYDTAGAYVGDATQVKRNVAPSVEVRVNLTGPEVFSFTPVSPTGPSDVFALLSTISSHLRSGTPADFEALANDDIKALDAAFVRVQNAVSTVGARYHQVEMLRDRVENSVTDLHSSLAEVESIDLPKTIVELEMQEVAYKSALSAAARVLQPSLIDFLR